MASNTEKARANWLAPYKDALLFPATSISIEVTGRDQPMCVQLLECIDIMVTLLLCNKLHGNDTGKVRLCAERLLERAVDPHNRRFLREVIAARLPDAQMRLKIRQMREADAKAQKAMKRAGDWPDWMA